MAEAVPRHGEEEVFESAPPHAAIGHAEEVGKLRSFWLQLYSMHIW